MGNADYYWEPPLAGTEAEHLFGSLDRLRTTFRYKADELDAAGLQVRIGVSAMTLGGLLKHLAAVEDIYSAWNLSGDPPGEPWQSHAGDNEWHFTSAVDDSPAELYAMYDAAVERSRERFAAAVAAGGLDAPTHAADDEGRHASIRRMVFDLVEEYGRHTGHADLIREAVDGRVGEDPPGGWRPVGSLTDQG